MPFANEHVETQPVEIMQVEVQPQPPSTGSPDLSSEERRQQYSGVKGFSKTVSFPVATEDSQCSKEKDVGEEKQEKGMENKEHCFLDTLFSNVSIFDFIFWKCYLGAVNTWPQEHHILDEYILRREDQLRAKAASKQSRKKTKQSDEKGPKAKTTHEKKKGKGKGKNTKRVSKRRQILKAAGSPHKTKEELQDTAQDPGNEVRKTPPKAKASAKAEAKAKAAVKKGKGNTNVEPKAKAKERGRQQRRDSTQEA